MKSLELIIGPVVILTLVGLEIYSIFKHEYNENKKDKNYLDKIRISGL